MAEAKCPVCSSKILLDDTNVVKCQKCEVPHHTDCFDSIGKKCAIFGCGTLVPQTQEVPLVITEKDLDDAALVLSRTIENTVWYCWLISSPLILYTLTLAPWGPVLVKNPSTLSATLFNLFNMICFMISALGCILGAVIATVFTIMGVLSPLFRARNYLVKKIAEKIARNRISNQSK